MHTTVEISMYPLRSDYEEQVLKFIDLLKLNENVNIKVNAMSTQVVGEFDEVFDLLNASIKVVYKDGVKASFVIKVLPGSLNLDFSL